MKKTVFNLFLIATFQIAIVAQNVTLPLTNELAGIVANSSIEGIGVAVFTKDTLLYSKGFGHSSKNPNLSYQANTPQKIASLSKLLLGVSLLKAQELNLIDLEDDINQYLPFNLSNPYHPTKQITIRNLATHTASLSKLPKYDLRSLYAPTKIARIRQELPFGLRKLILNKYIKKINRNREVGLEEFLSNLYSTDGKWYRKKHFLKKEPGEQTVYSNSGASLLALIIQKSSGMKYNDFVTKYVLEPLSMNNTKFDFEASDSVPQKSDCYHSGIEVPNDFRLLLYPAGGLESTVLDFYKFMKAIAFGRLGGSQILSKESINEMLQPQLKQEFEQGILWEVYPSGYVGHTGDILGTTTLAYYNVEKDIGYILFCNTGGTKTIDTDIDKVRSKVKEYFPF